MDVGTDEGDELGKADGDELGWLVGELDGSDDTIDCATQSLKP